MPKKKGNMLGAWAFLIGVIIAVIFGFLAMATWVYWVLVVIGILIGLLNITDVEAQPFLIAGVILVIVSYFGGSVFGVDKLGVNFLAQILENLLILFVPATIIVALKSVFSLAKR
ncbi:MAG: hypothetical protein IB618_00115 [Candidatus Pacearchaeota archaeon]|nr:MAG: hypothetical protein IB618_00115 [Candidatus Pacearchaeota archaeon]